VLAVAEPELLVFLIAKVIAEHEVVRIKLLPTLGTGRGFQVIWRVETLSLQGHLLLTFLDAHL
jgi:hypothetical protein